MASTPDDGSAESPDKAGEPTKSAEPGENEQASAPDASMASDETAADETASAEKSAAADEPAAADEIAPADESAAAEPSTDKGSADTTESDTDEPAAESRGSGYPPALIATAVALPVALVIAVLVAAIMARNMPVEREPLVLGPVPAPAADSEACATLLPALPADLGEFTKSTLVEPAPPATRAWQRPDGGEPIVLRCGLDRPLEFNRASPIQMVNGVQWFEIPDPDADASTWFAVDRATYIALTIPGGSGPTPLQEVSDTITANLPAQPLDPGPLPN
ncbi:Protein of uncharacterised function (DUF3515) [Nocardia cyriacigeorgica]|uniref:Protein of uncharacterized function (DUF3515) n=3 Tax=Nocardia cyriacigeorgica TaxID=135487 RepID=A0A4U8W315_9NOCA|nr:DUF3515 domain-containing protein [Nocardia cyriacigeorgica]VFA98844.1 Protein of uncharacterised function (DUF3515) [Nocardia cyriacigeorgica]